MVKVAKRTTRAGRGAPRKSPAKKHTPGPAASGSSKQPNRKPAAPHKNNSQPALNIYDPANPLPVPVMVHCGNAVHICTNHKSTFSSSGQKQIFCIATTGDSSTVGFRVDNEATPVLTKLDTTQLKLDGDAGGPTSGRPEKIGFQLTNFTKILNQGGLVYVLKSDRKMWLPTSPSSMNQSEWNTLGDAIKSHVDARPYAGSAFASGMSFFAGPRDTVAYNSFRNWYGSTTTIDTFAQYAAEYAGPGSHQAEFRSGMDFFWIVVDTQTTDFNDYQLRIDKSDYTRWPVESVVSNLQSLIPVAKLDKLNADAAAAGALDKKDVKQGGRYILK